MVRQKLLPRPLEVKIFSLWGHIWKHIVEKNQMRLMWIQAGDLRGHLKAHSGERSNKCNQCDFTFIQAGNLRPHLKAHSGEKPKNTFDVTLHLLRPAIWKYHNYNTNLGEKPLMKTHFNCDWCGKYIISDRALREHIERHIQERSPFNTLEL